MAKKNKQNNNNNYWWIKKVNGKLVNYGRHIDNGILYESGCPELRAKKNMLIELIRPTEKIVRVRLIEEL